MGPKNAMAQKEDDGELVRRCLKNEPLAFEELLQKYKNRVFSLIYRMVQHPEDAEDIAQESFIKAFRHLDSYDPSRPFISWLFKIANNTTLDFLRVKNPETLSIHGDENPIEIADNRFSQDLALDAAFQKEKLEKLLNALPPLYRQALILRHQEGLNYKEIGEILQVPEGTVKIRLFRARNLMKEKWAALNAE